MGRGDVLQDEFLAAPCPSQIKTKGKNNSAPTIKEE